MKYAKKSQIIAVAFLLLAVGHTAFAQSAKPRQEKLLNGLKVLMWEDPSAERLSISLRIHSGAAFDPQGKEGVMQLLADSLFPNVAIRESFVEDLGGSLNVAVNHDYIQIDTTSAPQYLVEVLEILAGAVSNPAIDKESTEKVRSALIDRVKEWNSDPANVGDDAVAARLLGTYPYGRPVSGTVGSLSRISFADLIDARVKFLTADNATLAITGKFDRSSAHKAARRLFGSWLKSERRIPSTFQQPEAPLAEALTIVSPREGATATRFALRSLARSDKESAASMIFSQVLQQRLQTVSSSAFVRNSLRRLPGVIVVGSPDTSLSAARLSSALSAPVTEEEFQSAKRAAHGLWNLRSTMDFWLDADTYDLAEPSAQREAINSVTLPSVRSYAERLSKLPIAAVVVAPKPAN